MSEMVERVARAIHDARWSGTEPGPMEGTDYEYAHRLATAAIEAMREPTEAMLGGFASYIDGRGTAEIIWDDMIEQALK
jgi:hypothetical protein